MNEATLLTLVNDLHRIFDPLLYELASVDPVRAADLRIWLFDRLVFDDGQAYTTNNLRVALTLVFEDKSGGMPARDIFDRVFNRKDENGQYYLSSDRAEPAHTQFHKATHFELKPHVVIDDEAFAKFHEFYGSSFDSVNHPSDGYARCVNFPTFFNYLVLMDKEYEDSPIQMSKYLIIKDWEDGKENIEIDFPKIPASNNVNMRGGKPLGWVAPQSELLSIIELQSPSVELAQRLGIGIKNSVDPDPQYYDVLVLIKYDVSFSQKVYQPAIIHADWNGGGFVSYHKNDDCYGLTCNCCVTGGSGIPERVHISFPVITDGPGAYDHSAIIVGRVDQAVRLDYHLILTETISRFNHNV